MIGKILFLIMFVFLQNALAQEHFVSPEGAASWPECVTESVTCSADTAFTEAVAGDIVNFRGGVYEALHDYDSYHAHFEPANSGTVDAPIIFKAYPGETPHMDCVVNGTYEGCAALGNGDQDYIIFDGFTVTTDNGSLIGTILITGFNKGVYAKGCVVRNCIIDGGSTPVSSTDNRETLRIEATADTVIENNIIKNMISSINNHNTSLIKTYDNDNLTILNNEFYNAQLAVYLKRLTNVGVVENNYIHNVNEGIYINASIDSNSNDITIRNNVVSHCSTAFCTVATSEDRTVDNLTYANNTIYETNRGIAIGENQNGLGGIIYNNIVVGEHSKIVTDGTAELKESDHNNFAGYVYIVTNLYEDNEATFRDLPSWQTSGKLADGSNPGSGSLSADPLFENASGNLNQLDDFRLASGSPCIGAGRGGVDMGADIDLVGINPDSPPQADNTGSIVTSGTASISTGGTASVVTQ